MASWYADTRRLRTCDIRRTAMPDFESEIITSCRSTPGSARCTGGITVTPLHTGMTHHASPAALAAGA